MWLPIPDIKALREAVFSGGMDLPGMQPVLDLYRDLFDAATTPLGAAGGVRLPSSEEARMRLEEGFSLLDLPGFMPPEADLRRRASEVLSVLSRHTERPPSESAPLGKGEVLSVLSSGYLAGGEERLRTLAAEVDGLNSEIALLVVFASLKGTFLSAAERAASLDTGSWTRKSCPVCSGAAAAAFLAGEGGARHLVCHRCHSRWRVARIFCPSCESTDHEGLAYFTIEGREAGPRVDHCARCSRYVKTWDVRDREGLIPEAEDLKSPAVDHVARHEGYLRAGPNVFGVSSFGHETEPFPAMGDKG